MPRTKKAATAGGRFRFQYAAKFLCTANIPGTSQTTTSLLPGVYETVVNLHNPNRQRARIRRKLALAHPPAISDFLDGHLEPDEAKKIDCAAIRDFGTQPIHGAEGFLVIESTLSLDVVAVYTAGKRGGEVESIDVEQVPERRIG